MTLLEAITDGWAWKGIDPVEVVDSNPFGNVLVRDRDGRIWRIVPEDLEATVVAESDEELADLFDDPWFKRDWEMETLVEIARARLGPVDDERCYCLKIPSVLGGEFVVENLGTITRDEVLSASGSIASQIDGLPDGTKIELQVIHPDEAERQGG